MSDDWRLLADVGGTNIRFGLAREPRSGRACDIEDARSWPSEAFSNFGAALEKYIATLGGGIALSSVAVAAAGPATPDAIALTNKNWTITKDCVQRTIGSGLPVRLVNDLEGVAYALPVLQGDAIEWLDDVRPPTTLSGRQLAINVGTGFGSATVICNGDDWVCCPAESGHMQLGFADTREQSLFANLGLSEPTIEDVLSGAGVRRLRDGMIAAGATPAPCGEVFDAVNTDAATNELRAVFGGFLARTAANLALASAAWDGVFLCGSVALAWSQQADRASFRRAFSGSSKMQERLAKTPVGFIRHAYPALVGLANLRMTVR